MHWIAQEHNNKTENLVMCWNRRETIYYSLSIIDGRAIDLIVDQTLLRAATQDLQESKEDNWIRLFL